jgi:hypothetical protein
MTRFTWRDYPTEIKCITSDWGKGGLLLQVVDDGYLFRIHLNGECLLGFSRDYIKDAGGPERERR